MRERIVINKHGIPKRVPLLPAVGNHRECIMPYVRVGNGKKVKNTYRSEQQAQAYIRNKLQNIAPSMSVYRCKLHEGWHIGHRRKT